MIFKSAQRCQKIVQSLLSFARRHRPERKPVCVNSLIEAAVEILQYQLRTSNIEVITQLDPDLPQAMVDPHQMQQVFLNIINNARQAIEAHQPKGRIRITTEAAAGNVRVTFQDNGPGIPPRASVEDFRSVLHDQGSGQGHRARPEPVLRHHQGTRRHHHPRQPAGRRRHLRHRTAHHP